MRRQPTTPAVELSHISLSFDGRAALRDDSFRLRRGQMICLTGASGSGKSVRLRLLGWAAVFVMAAASVAMLVMRFR